MTALREAVKVCAERLDIFRRTKDETHLDTCVRYLNGAQESTRNALRAASAAPLGYWRDEADKEDERAEAMQPVAADAEASEDYPERLRLMAYGLSQYIVSRNPEHPEYVRADACDTSILTGLEAMDTNVRKSMRIAELESQCAQLTRRIEEARKSWQWHQDRADGQEKRAREAESDRDRLAAEVARLEAENERLQPLKNGAWAKHMLLNQVLDEMRGDPELKAFAEKERDRIENEMLIPPPPTDKQPAPTTPTAEQSVDALVEECSNQAAAIDRRGGAHKIAHCFAPLAQRLTQAERKCAFEIGRFKYLQEITDSIAAHQRGVIETSRDRIANLQAKLAEAQKERDDLARKLNAVKEAAG
jgi:predicted RNase H-like nuclease (RuvC/YqgF family)